MVDDLEERLSRYRADLDTAVAADLARRHRASAEAAFQDANPLPLDTDLAIRLEPTMSAPYDRRRVMLAATLGIAATLVLVALVATRDDDVTPADQPSLPVAVTTAVPPRALPNTPGQHLEPGTYFVDNDGTSTARIVFTIGAGWSDISSTAGLAIGTGIGFITLGPSGAVFSDACHWRDGDHSGPVATVDGFVAALREQGGWAEVTAPSDISIDGFVGKAVQRTAPAVFSDCDITEYSPRLTPASENGVKSYPAFRSWQNEDFDGDFYEPGEIETLWVLDIDGTVVVIDARALPESSVAGRAELTAVLDSIRIDPR